MWKELRCGKTHSVNLHNLYWLKVIVMDSQDNASLYIGAEQNGFDQSV